MDVKPLTPRQAEILRCACNRGNGYRNHTLGKDIRSYANASYSTLNLLCKKVYMEKVVWKNFPLWYGQVWYRVTEAGYNALVQYELNTYDGQTK